jgi:hypothetical protein
MPHALADRARSPHFVRIGSDVFPVYGDDRSGWSLDPRDLSVLRPRECRYGNLAELFFALVNLNLSCEGRA